MEAEERRKLRATLAYRIAVHEAGHAVCAWASPYTWMITEVRLDDDRCSGHVWLIGLRSQQSPVLWHNIVIDLGGIAAEAKEFRGFRSGPAETDLVKALAFARTLAERGDVNPPWGGSELPANAFDLSKLFRSVVAGSPEARILNLAYVRAKALVKSDQERLYRMAEDLTEKGVLGKADITYLFGFRLPRLFS
jgi:cell division protease FtsH